jgi:DNA-binding IscR family transcriptional regulator
VAVAEAFARGEPATAHRLAEAAGLSDGQARTLLNGLEDAGLVHRIASERGPGPRSESFALSRPPETIAVAEVVEVGQSLSGPVTGGTGGELIAKIRRAQIDAVSGVTLASLVKVPGAKGSASATAKPSAPQPAPPSTAVPTAASMAATDPSLPNVATAANGHAHGKAAAVSAGEPTANLPSEPRTEPRP